MRQKVIEKKKEKKKRLMGFLVLLKRLQVQIPVDAPIGIWKLEVYTGEAGDAAERLRLYNCPNDIYVLFNPWCEGLYTARR